MSKNRWSELLKGREMKEEAEKDKGEGPKLWGVVLFGLIGATATTFAVSFPPVLPFLQFRYNLFCHCVPSFFFFFFCPFSQSILGLGSVYSWIFIYLLLWIWIVLFCEAFRYFIWIVEWWLKSELAGRSAAEDCWLVLCSGIHLFVFRYFVEINLVLHLFTIVKTKCVEIWL